MGNYRIGQAYFGSDEVKTSAANQEIIQQHIPSQDWTIPLSAYKFTFYPFNNCTIKINDGDAILAIIDNSATIKIFKKQNDVIILYPNSYNKSHQPIYLDKGRENIINGKVISVFQNPTL